MLRLVTFAILFLFPFSVLAQDALSPDALSPPVHPLPQNPALLMRMREDIAQQLQQTQRMLAVVNPNETQFYETLQAQQTELAKQLSDITSQLLTLSTPVGSIPPGFIPHQGPLPSMIPRQPMPAGMFDSAGGNAPNTPRDFDFAPSGSAPSNSFPQPALPPEQNVPSTPYAPPAGMPQWAPSFPPNNLPPNWQDQQNQTWETIHWGPRLPKELTELTQTVGTLRAEVSDLKATVKALETQIQLLNRHILMSERMGGAVHTPAMPITTTPIPATANPDTQGNP